ncbi:MAG: hypothetical protein O3B99_08970, partial [Proteobacteria bacterium]|nr:hypothetical protein [Pseudomonadota bacterium]
DERRGAAGQPAAGTQTGPFDKKASFRVLFNDVGSSRKPTQGQADPGMTDEFTLCRLQMKSDGGRHD